MKKNLSMTIAIGGACLLLASCADDETIDMVNQGPTPVFTEVTTLQNRNPQLPTQVRTNNLITLKAKTRATNGSGALIGNSDKLLGYSYSVGNSVLGDFSNVGYQVVDIDKVKALPYTGYVSSKALQAYMSDRFSYADGESYAHKLSRTKKISYGFQLNLGLFKLGRKKKVEETFKSISSSSTHSVFGELNLLYANSAFNLQSSDGAKKLYARECLSTAFMKNLYSSTMSNILETYGQFILTGYITGGKAFALYAGETQSDESMTLKEKDMDHSIDASFSWKKDSASGDFKFGKGNCSADTSSYNMQKLYTRLWLYGGTPHGASMNSADELKSIDFNLSPWVESLADNSKHTIIDLTENGIAPISTFVLEENYRKRFDCLMSGIARSRPKLIMPKIVIMRVFERYAATGEALYDIAPVLITRQGDYIILRSGIAATQTDGELRRNEDAAVFSQKAHDITNRESRFYELKIDANPVTRLNPVVSSAKYINIDIKKIDESSMYVYTNERTNIQYIYDVKNKVAFSHYIDALDEDWLLDEYGIRTWVEELPVKKISMASLANSYHIIGL